MHGMSDIEYLLALEEIRLLKARRDRAVDTKDWALYRSLHADNHVSHNDGYARWESADVMIENVKALLDETKTSVHHSHTPEIEFESATTAKGIWAMEGMSFWTQDGQDHWFQAFGHYFESYERREDRWLFTSRSLKYYFTRKSPGAIFPPKISN